MDEETDIERTPRNAAKIEILNILNTMGESTAWQIALITNRSPEAASMCLFRYHGMGLLSRRTLHGRVKAYRITARGRARLVWLESLEEGTNAQRKHRRPYLDEY